MVCSLYCISLITVLSWFACCIVSLLSLYCLSLITVLLGLLAVLSLFLSLCCYGLLSVLLPFDHYIVTVLSQFVQCVVSL